MADEILQENFNKNAIVMREYFNLDSPMAESTLESLVERGERLDLIVNCGNTDGLFDVAERVQQLQERLSGTNLRIDKIRLDYNKTYIYDEQDVAELSSVDSLFREQGIDFYVNLNDASEKYGVFGSGSVEQIVHSRDLIEDFVGQLDEITLDGEPLSVAEKFVCVYQFAANRVYNESENFMDENMRNWVGVLTTDEVICSGFSSLLSMLCDRVFDKEELRCFEQGSKCFNHETKELVGGHANNIVYLNDPKYGINGVFHCDSCWDSIKNNDFNTMPSVNFCLLPLDKISRAMKYDIQFDNRFFVYDDYKFPEYKKEEDYARWSDHHTMSLYQKTDEVEFNKFLIKRFDKTSLNEITRLALKKEKEEQAAEENERETYRGKLISFCETARLDPQISEILDTEVCGILPEKLVKRDERFAEANKFFGDLSFETGALDFDKLSSICALYQERESVINEYKQRARDLGLKAFATIEDMIINNCVDNDRPLSGSRLENQYKEKVAMYIYTRNKAIVEQNRDFLFAPDVPNDALYNGLQASAFLMGINDPLVREQYAADCINMREQNFADKFNNYYVDNPVSSGKEGESAERQ